MIKKFVVLLIICLAAFGVKAQTPAVPKFLENMSFDEIKGITADPKKNEDLFVQMLFSIPPEYHQYIMPMVADIYGISEKVRMMPGIVEWRRKLPTRIAPQLADFAEKHLRYLNRAFYPYLMPEMWPQKETEGHSHHQFVPQVIKVNSPEELERVFPSSIKPNSFLGQLMSGDYKVKEKKSKTPALTEKDVASVVTVMGKLKKLEEGSKGRERRNILILDYKDMNLLVDAHINPCQSIVSHLDKINADKWLEFQVKQENMTVPEFVQKCDATIKAYRMRLAAPGVLIAIQWEAERAMELPKDSHQRRLVMALISMFDTTHANLDAIKGKEEELNKLFRDKLLFLGTPVLLDF